MRQPAALALTLSLAIPGFAAASGSSAMTPPRQQMPTASPEQEATEYYNDGISYRDKADKYEKEATAENDAAKKAKLLEKSKGQHESSIKKYLKAVAKNPQMVPAWGSLGYAYRKAGNYPAALEAYDKALALEKSYTPAIEYRAEAYLGLGRLDDVKSAYMTLFNTDRKRADELTSAIDQWLERKKSDPTGIDPTKLDEFGKWASDRKQLAAQTSSLTDPNVSARW
jgi:tetratricopeptide (TPR) repeat protein